MILEALSCAASRALTPSAIAAAPSTACRAILERAIQDNQGDSGQTEAGRDHGREAISHGKFHMLC